MLGLLLDMVLILMWFPLLVFFVCASGACISCLWEPADTGIRPLGRAVNAGFGVLWALVAVVWAGVPMQLA